MDYTCHNNGFVDVTNRTAILYDVGSAVATSDLEALDTEPEPQYIDLPGYGTLKETEIRGPNGAVTTKATFSHNGRPFFIGYEVGSFYAGRDMPWGTYSPTPNWTPIRDQVSPRTAILRVKTVGGRKPGPYGCRSRIQRESFCAQFWVYGKLEDRLLADKSGSENFIC